MAQWLIVLTTLPEDLGLNLSTHKAVYGQPQGIQRPLLASWGTASTWYTDIT